MTKLLILLALLVLLYRRVLYLWENQRPGAALITAVGLTAIGVSTLSELTTLVSRSIAGVTRLG